jgi:hypothetical protein
MQKRPWVKNLLAKPNAHPWNPIISKCFQVFTRGIDCFFQALFFSTNLWTILNWFQTLKDMYTCIWLIKAPHHALEVCFVVSKVVPKNNASEITYSGKTGLHYFVIGDISSCEARANGLHPYPSIHETQERVAYGWHILVEFQSMYWPSTFNCRPSSH